MTLIQRNNKIIWAASGMRADVGLTPENLFPLLWKAGCRYISFGIESGDPDVLLKIGRKVTHKEIERALFLARRYGFKTCGGFTIGHVWENTDESLGGETEKDVTTTINYIQSLIQKKLLWSLQMSVVSPMPGSRLYDAVNKRRLLYTNDFEKLGKYDRTLLSFKHPYLTSDILSHYYKKAYTLISLNPMHIWQLIANIKDIYDVLGLIRVGLFVIRRRLLN